MKKYVKYTKRIIALLVIAVLNLQTFATTSSNDGADLITKADFDRLVTDFNQKMDEYQAGLNSKIDYAIANYIAGMSVVSTQDIDTGLDLEAPSNKVVKFIKKDNNYLYMSNDPYGKDSMFNVAGGTYAPISVFTHDCYDTLVFSGYKENGSTSNLLFLLDANGCINEKWKNCRIQAERTYVFYSTTNATHGLLWRSANQTLNTPTEVYSSSTAYINGTTMQGFGYKQSSSETTGPGSPWNHGNSMWARYRNDYNTSTHATSNHRAITQYVWDTENQTFTLSNVAQETVVSITGTAVSRNVDVEHWQLGSNYKIKTSTAEWGSKGLIAAAATSRSNYTAKKEARATSGPGCYRVSILNPVISGYGIKFKYTEKTPSEVYYQNIYNNWDNKKLSAGGGFPFLYHKNDGTVTVKLTLSTAATICFTTAQSTTFPASGSSNLVTFEYQPAGDQFIKTTNPVLLGAGTYTFKIPVLNAKPVFLCADWATTETYLYIQQRGKAKIAFNN